MASQPFLDAEHFDLAATWAARQLSRYQRAVLTLTPGDGTAYRLVLVGPSRVWDQGDERGRSCYWVTLLGTFGHGAEWTPGGYVHWTYTAEQWVAKVPGASREHTAKVLAGFLNTLDERITARQGGCCVDGGDHSWVCENSLPEGRVLMSCLDCPAEGVREPDGTVVPVGEEP